MQDKEALELLDAHLDDILLTEQQIEELSAWLQKHPEHAETAFHRIFLHSFLRRRIHAQRLHLQGDCIQSPSDDVIDVEPISDLRRYSRGQTSPQPRRLPLSRRGLIALGAVATCAIVVAFLATNRPGTSNAPPITSTPIPLPTLQPANVYEGFDYPATSIPGAAIDPDSWPISGGLQDLNGGSGWAEPWQETGPKVSAIFDHAREMNWDPKDMRKFSPLGHTDSQGHVLQTTGLQMRTAMGIRSLTSRKLDLSVFPENMKDENGLGKDGTVLWLSFLAQSYNSTASNNRFTYLQIGSREISGFRIGKVGAAPAGNWCAMGLQTGAQVNLRTSSIPSGEMTFFLVRLEFREGPEEVAVWLNPILTDEPRQTEAALRLSIPDFRFDSVTINANYSTDLDELRIGETFRMVAPVQ